MRELPRSLSAYFASYALSLLGNGLASVVFPLLVLERTGSLLAAGVVATVGTAGSVVVGLLAGVWVDRSNRRTLSILADLLSASSLIALVVIDAAGHLDLTWFVVLAALGALVDVPGETAREVLLPALVRRRSALQMPLETLVAARESLAAGMVLIGPGIGGLLVWLVGLDSTLLMITAGCSVTAALVTLAVDAESGRAHLDLGTPLRGQEARPAPGSSGGMWRELVSGWRFLLATPVVLVSTLLSMALVALLAPMQTTLLPSYFAAEGLAALTGLFISAIAAGTLAGSLVYAATCGRISRTAWLVLAMIGATSGFAAVASLLHPALVFGGAVLVGASITPAGTILGIITLDATPDSLRGRVLAAQNVLSDVATALLLTPVAWLASSTSARTAGLTLAGVFALIAIGLLSMPALRRTD